MRIVAESNARGQLTERLMLMTAPNSLYDILLLKISVGVMHLDRNAGLLQTTGHPTYIALDSLQLGAVLAYAMHLTRYFHLKRESQRFGLVIAVVLLGTTAADRLGLLVPKKAAWRGAEPQMDTGCVFALRIDPRRLGESGSRQHRHAATPPILQARKTAFDVSSVDAQNL